LRRFRPHAKLTLSKGAAMRRALAIALSLVLAGCTATYVSPITDNGGSGAALGPAEQFPGIGDVVRAGPTRVVWVHGMCTHKPDWAYDRFDALAAMLGASPPRVVETPDRPDGAKTLSFHSSVESAPLRIDYILWSPLTTPFKRALYYDRPEGVDGGTFPYKRAKLNAQLKTTLMNDCLADAVVYSGPNGKDVRAFMRDAVCRALGGDPATGGCAIREPAAETTVFVAESLGSKMLFDAVRGIWEANRKSPRAAATLEARLSTVQLVFMLANQVPILDVADEKAPTGGPGALAADAPAGGRDSSLVDFLSLPGLGFPSERASAFMADAPRELPPVHVVAFTDPNDLLSYRLDPSLLHLPRVRVANVIASNAPTYLGLFEMPDSAHCGYKWNPYVLGAVAEGLDANGIRKSPVRIAKVCGLAGRETAGAPPS
jgi:hypothetical protein